MATLVKIGPDDHGRPMTLDEFLSADYEDGYRFELIDGRLYVSPLANQPENFLQEWIRDRLKEYLQTHPEILKHVTGPARVFVPGRSGITTPEPDLAAYAQFPFDRPLAGVHWQDISPVLVVEVLSADDPHKDLVRNRALYLMVPSIKEYWVLDGREDVEHPKLRVHRRRGRKWLTRDFEPNEIYTTKLLPGFELILDLHR
jgi:Uma2 family endonuclease